jgi:predicted RNA-binding Zn ribbon-like protein
VGKKRDAGSIKLIGGALCLDFVNTVHCYGCPDLGEYLNSYYDLVTWSRHVGTITAAEAGTLSAAAAKHPAGADKAHRRAVELREIIYGIFCSAVEGLPPAPRDLAAFNDLLSGTMMESQIVKARDGYYWDISGNKAKLDWILNPVIRSAAELLTSEEFRRTKKCADPTCGWLFLDRSRNRSRRWCDMRDCGNRAKAGRFYKKKKRSSTIS